MDRVRLYESIRTAHLERAHQLAPATILYRVTRYDFDTGLAEGLDLVQAGPLRTAVLLAASSPRIVEVNEPLMTSSLVATAVALVGLRIGELRSRRRTLVVTYAIENDDPLARPRPKRLRSRLRRAVEARLARLVWRRLDRIVFGTSGARETYRSALGAPAERATVAVVPAVPAPFHTGAPYDGSLVRDPRGVLFVGALSERKGIRVLLAAWPLVVEARPDARLTVVGTGSLEREVREAIADDPSVRLVVDPPRDEIHHRYDEAAVVTLPSQPSPHWREQVGLPIVEALSHGCRVVTTDQTGLAAWLAEHGHFVIPGSAGPRDLADALLAALDSPPDREGILRSLPARDGRLAADDVLFA